MSSFAAMAARDGKPPSKEEISYLLAHFSSLLKDEDLIAACQREVKIMPIGIKPHPKGALLAFRNQEDSAKLLEKVAHLTNASKKIPLTVFPELQTPVQLRGKRWRISNVPFTVSSENIKEALRAQDIPATEVKLETVRNYPGTRTPFVTFWTREEKMPPKKLELDGEKALIFDPEKKNAAQPAMSNQPIPPTQQQPANTNKQKQTPQPSTTTITKTTPLKSILPSPSTSAAPEVEHPKVLDSMAVDPKTPDRKRKDMESTPPQSQSKILNSLESPTPQKKPIQLDLTQYINKDDPSVISVYEQVASKQIADVTRVARTPKSFREFICKDYSDFNSVIFIAPKSNEDVAADISTFKRWCREDDWRTPYFEEIHGCSIIHPTRMVDHIKEKWKQDDERKEKEKQK